MSEKTFDSVYEEIRDRELDMAKKGLAKYRFDILEKRVSVLEDAVKTLNESLIKIFAKALEIHDGKVKS